ncbi:MAG: hypothetical protein H0T56_02275 [Pseudaminobacter sp.]|nr:hypothetical protein [Pseudaminobacter sp.]
MPRYYFHLRDGDQLREDFEGEDLADLAAVEETAMAAAKEIIAEGLLAGQPVLTNYSFEVCDEQRNTILRFPFVDAANKSGSRP